MKKQFDTFEKQSKFLQSLANQFETGSFEHSTLRRATMALLYVTVQRAQDFEDFVKNSARDLSPDQKAYLRSLGLKDE